MGPGTLYRKKNEVYRVKKSKKSEFHLDWCVWPILRDLQGLAVH